MEKNQQDKPKPAEKPISLHPLKFEEAVEGLLRVEPELGKVSHLKGDKADGRRKTGKAR